MPQTRSFLLLALAFVGLPAMEPVAAGLPHPGPGPARRLRPRPPRRPRRPPTDASVPVAGQRPGRGRIGVGQPRRRRAEHAATSRRSARRGQARRARQAGHGDHGRAAPDHRHAAAAASSAATCWPTRPSSSRSSRCSCSATAPATSSWRRTACSAAAARRPTSTRCSRPPGPLHARARPEDPGGGPDLDRSPTASRWSSATPSPAAAT